MLFAFPMNCDLIVIKSSYILVFTLPYSVIIYGNKTKLMYNYDRSIMQDKT